MSTDNNSHLDIVQELNVWRRCKTSRVKCEILRTIAQVRTLSADIPAGQKRVFILCTLPLIFVLCNDSKFCCLFFLSSAAFDIIFLYISMTRIHKTSLFLFHMEHKDEKVNHLSWFFPLALLRLK